MVNQTSKISPEILQITLAGHMLTLALAFNTRLLNIIRTPLVETLYTTNRATLMDLFEKGPHQFVPVRHESAYLSRNTQAEHSAYDTVYGYGFSIHPERPREKRRKSCNTQSIARNQGSMQYDIRGKSIREESTFDDSTLGDSTLFENFLPKQKSSR